MNREALDRGNELLKQIADRGKELAGVYENLDFVHEATKFEVRVEKPYSWYEKDANDISWGPGKLHESIKLKIFEVDKEMIVTQLNKYIEQLKAEIEALQAELESL